MKHQCIIMMMKNTILHYTSEGACLFSGDTQFQLHSKTQRLFQQDCSSKQNLLYQALNYNF